MQLPWVVQRVLTGIKPSQTPHLGNYLGAIRPALQLANSYQSSYFIADYHALTTLQEPEKLQSYTYDVAACWLACGLDPQRTRLFRQSDIPAHTELMWILSCIIATGQLMRGHAFKAASEQGESPNAGIFNYPVLMAADILLHDTDVVPVGQDQKQHVELCRDVALRFNHLFGAATLVVPAPRISEAPLVPGIDGLKMSKSSGNSIPLFASADELRGVIMKIKTGSEPLEAPKDPEGSVVFQLFKLVATPEKTQSLAERLRAGGYGWGHAKVELYEALEQELGPRRAVFAELRRDTTTLDAILRDGAEQVRPTAEATMQRVRRAVGLAPHRIVL